MKGVGWLVLTQRGAQALYGLITVLVIAKYLTPEAQGWYYSFLSYASIYTLFDLGFSVALVPFFARFFYEGGLSIRGDFEQRIAESLDPELSRILRWYGLIACAFIGIVLPTGVLFFLSASSNGEWESWLLPWVLLVGATGVTLLWMPILALIEAAGYVSEVTSIRLVQLTIGSSGCWLALYLGSGYWAAVAVTLSNALIISGWLMKHWPALLKRAYSVMRQSGINQVRLKPVPWRVAVSWVCAYLTSQIFTLMLMQMEGPVIAGKFALSLSVVSMTGVLALSSMAGRVAYVGQAAARNDWSTIGRTLRQDLLFFSMFYLLSFVGICLVFWVFDGWQILNRFLPIGQMLGLLLFTFVIYLLNLMATYIRAFLREPFAKVYLLGTLCALPSAYVASTYYSSAGVVLVLVMVACLWFLPVSIWVFRKELQLAKNGCV